MRRAPPARILLPTDKTTARDIRECRGLAIAQRHINVLAPSGLPSAQESRHDGITGVESCGEIRDRYTDLHRRAIPTTRNVHQPKLSFDHDIVTGAIRVGASLTISCDTCIDEPWVNVAQGGVVQPILGKAARQIILNQDIAFGDQLVQDLYALWMLKGETKRLLVSVHREEVSRFAWS